MKPWAIFLGGRDLEMVEIAKLVAGRDDLEVHDRQLPWGATASAYAADIRAALDRGRAVIVVELPDDLPADLPREHVTWVDHHGALAGADRPTSVEQVFALLGFASDRWTRDLTLVAANDRGHVRAMQAAGATREEIAAIRARDRQAQGVTASEEAEGRAAACRAETRCAGRLTVVRLPHARTATVTDVLDAGLGGPGYRNLVVFCPGQTAFFGTGRCIDALRESYPDGWHGGELPTRGFWGTARPLPESEILPRLETAIVTKPATEVTVDKFHHILIWPLIIRGEGPGVITRWVAALPTAWQDVIGEDGTSAPSDVEYEEIVYYQPFARDFLYADGLHARDKRPCRRFKRTDVGRVKVTVKRDGNSPELDLTVHRAELYLCKPNIALFCLEVSNRAADGSYVPLTLDVIHDFRDQFRRVHPPFWWGGRGPDATGAGLCPKAVAWDTLAVAKGQSLESPKAEFDRFTRVGAEPPVFSHWQCWFGDQVKPFQRLPDTKSPAAGGLYYQQVMDERMQCMSYLAVDNPAEIGQGDRDRLTFVDSAGDDPYPYNPAFLQKSRDGHTYDRFGQSEYLTHYYFCSYAFTAVGKAWEGAPEGRKPSFFSKLILTHFQQHYYRMGVIAHYQRAALLYFADEMSTAAKKLAELPPDLEATHEGYRADMNKVQMEFLKFRSRSYFPDVTNQLQGQEMNRLWHSHLGIRELFVQVDQTCDQINEVFTQKAAEKLAVSQEKLGRIAAVFLPLSVTLSLLSVLFAGDFLPSYAKLALKSDGISDPTNSYKVPHILAILTAVILAAASVVSYRLYRKFSPETCGVGG